MVIVDGYHYIADRDIEKVLEKRGTERNCNSRKIIDIGRLY